MIKLVGFNSMSGQLKSDKTGELIDWSNRTLRCITDDNLNSGDFGFALLEQKLKKSDVCKSLGLNSNSTDKSVNDALCKLLNSKIEFIAGRVGKEIKINGFKVVQP